MKLSNNSLTLWMHPPVYVKPKVLSPNDILSHLRQMDPTADC